MTDLGKSDDENRVESLYQQGARAFADKQYLNAARLAQQAIAINAQLAPVHYLLATAQMELKAFSDAAAAYARCLALGPDAPLVQHAIMNWALAKVRADGSPHPKLLELTPTDITGNQRISIIICSIKPKQFERVCDNYRTLLSGLNHEIVGIHDARSLCEGYNRGLKKAKGDILIFSHDDIEIVSPDFAARLFSSLRDHDLIGISGTTKLVGPAWVYSGWPHYHGQVGNVNETTGQLTVQTFDIRKRLTPNAHAIDGVFLATRREVAERVGFDDKTFDGWHHYDLDFTFSAFLAGYRTAICSDICIIHQSRGNWGADWQRYANAFTQKYGDKLSLDGVDPNFDAWCYTAMNSVTEWLSVTNLLTQPGSLEFI